MESLTLLNVRDVRPFGTFRARTILGIVIAFLVTSTVSLVLRFVGKRIKKAKVSWEDWFIVAAQVVVYGLGAVSILQVVVGNAGHHASDASSKVPQALKLLIAVQCLYALSVLLIKVSICLFYNRIFPFRSCHIASWTAIALSAAWAIGAILYAFTSCRPFAFYWNPSLKEGSCVKNQVAAYVIIGAFDVVVDMIIFILPLPLLYKLRVSLADKIALLCIFGVGILTMILASLRVHALIKTSWTDVTYTGAPALILTILEPSIGISVACAPLSRPVFRHLFPRQEINFGNESSEEFGRLTSWELPNFVDRNLWRGRERGFGREEEFITTQVLESGTWSEAGEVRTTESRARREDTGG